LYAANPLEKFLASALSGGLGGASERLGTPLLPVSRRAKERVVSQMKKYSKPVVKTVEKGTIFASLA
jgi:hypothetical protein